MKKITNIQLHQKAKHVIVQKTLSVIKELLKQIKVKYNFSEAKDNLNYLKV